MKRRNYQCGSKRWHSRVSAQTKLANVVSDLLKDGVDSAGICVTLRAKNVRYFSSRCCVQPLRFDNNGWCRLLTLLSSSSGLRDTINPELHHDVFYSAYVRCVACGLWYVCERALLFLNQSDRRTTVTYSLVKKLHRSAYDARTIFVKRYL